MLIITVAISDLCCNRQIKEYETFIIDSKYKKVKKLVFDTLPVIYPQRKAKYQSLGKGNLKINEYSESESGDWSISYDYGVYHGKIVNFVYTISFFNSLCNDEITRLKYYIIFKANEAFITKKDTIHASECKILVNYPVELNQKINVQKIDYYIK